MLVTKTITVSLQKVKLLLIITTTCGLTNRILRGMEMKTMKKQFGILKEP